MDIGTKANFRSRVGGVGHPLRKRSAPTLAGEGAHNLEKSNDIVSLSAKARSSEKSSGLGKALLLGGMAALSLAAGTSGPAAAQALCVQAPCEVEQIFNGLEEHPGAPVEMIRHSSGEVHLYTGIENQVVHPDSAEHGQVLGSADAAWSRRGKTVCEQALNLGGECEGENIATVPTPYGTIIVEQNQAHSLDVYSQGGGHTRMEVEAGKVDVHTADWNAHFYNDGTIGYY